VEYLDVDEDKYDCGPAEDRQLNYSRVYGNKIALAALILALRCGLRAAEIVLLHGGSQITGM
jgi:hypothetical protein